MRSGFTTDNGNAIIDVHDLQIRRAPARSSSDIDSIVGVVTNGLFAARGADILLLGTAGGVIESRRHDARSSRLMAARADVQTASVRRSRMVGALSRVRLVGGGD